MVIANTWQPLRPWAPLDIRGTARAGSLLISFSKRRSKIIDMIAHTVLPESLPAWHNANPLCNSQATGQAWMSEPLYGEWWRSPYNRKGNGLLLVTPCASCHFYPLDTSIVCVKYQHKEISLQLLFYHDVFVFQSRLRCNRFPIFPYSFQRAVPLTFTCTAPTNIQTPLVNWQGPYPRKSFTVTRLSAFQYRDASSSSHRV